MTKITLECDFCKVSISRSISHYNRLLKRGQKNNFCSKACVVKRNKLVKSTALVCTQCSKNFRRCNSELKVVKNSFCSSSCAATYNNTHKTTGTRRSKLEQYLEKQLIILFPQLEIKFNDKTAINSELDIYFPDLKFAIELNGIYHYQPIYGEKKLKDVQNNDLVKREACNKQLITLVTIDTSPQKSWNPESSKDFLSTIVELLNSYKSRTLVL